MKRRGRKRSRVKRGLPEGNLKHTTEARKSSRNKYTAHAHNEHQG